jgi:eukaryotic-like serine/threonine-protein kinase
MPARADFSLEGILHLDRYERADRRSVFRQSIASIALAATGQAPLDGVDGAAVARSVQTAFADGLFEDLSWLAAPAAAVAVYEIAAVLPISVERRELGRRVGLWLYEGSAATFVAIATRMAAGSVRGLSTPGVHARVALAMGLPGLTDVPVDPLALALISRREVAIDWLGTRSTRSLPERRLSARLLERAAREAAARGKQGDDTAIRLFQRAIRRPIDPASGRRGSESEGIDGAFRVLLADRETLVWRHVAVARGLLSAAVPGLRDEIATAVTSGQTPTEWRRGATSLVANVAIDPDWALPAALELLKSPLLGHDPGIATAMLWGIPRASDAEPEAAAELLRAIAEAAPLHAAETLIELHAELGSLPRSVVERCAEALASTLDGLGGEDDALALGKEILLDITGGRGAEDRRPSGTAGRLGAELRDAINRSIEAFVEVGTREAFSQAQIALERATDAVEALEAIGLDESGDPRSAQGRGAAAILVRELDAHLLETGVLRNLCLLNRRPSDGVTGGGAVDELDGRLAGILLEGESKPFAGDDTPRYLTLHQRKLRALLHLVDGESSELEDDAEGRRRVQNRLTTTCRALIGRLADERPEHPLRRAITATVARALDALVRDGAADPADVFLYAAVRPTGVGDLAVLAEASMQPDTTRLLRAYGRFVDTERRIPASDGRARISALESLIVELPADSSQRVEALRSSLEQLLRALSTIQDAASLRPLAAAEGSPLTALEAAIDRLGQLTTSAIRRFGEAEETPAESDDRPGHQHDVFRLAVAADRAREPDADPATELRPSIAAAVERAFAVLPPALAGVVARILPRVASLPVDPPIDLTTPLDPARQLEGRLPAWLPSRRTLGGFYIHRQLGGGAAGTVFVVTRIEDRHAEGAERFALKVPDYDATAARSLSETDFLKLFREEAGALLAVPEHENLARFVTFDAATKPKPILVMELVEGTRCDQLLGSRLLTIPRALSLLDGVLAGLEAMHSVNVGHLDLKPSNVILRDSKTPVLVDFGLAGRNTRPGCATASYGAPEIWVDPAKLGSVSALPADIYSFGCFAYEVLTTITLFDAPNEVALIAAHMMHDGNSRPIRKLAERPATVGLARFLSRCLRRRPEDRATASELRIELRKIAGGLAAVEWPVSTG